MKKIVLIFIIVTSSILLMAQVPTPSMYSVQKILNNVLRDSTVSTMISEQKAFNTVYDGNASIRVWLDSLANVHIDSLNADTAVIGYLETTSITMNDTVYYEVGVSGVTSKTVTHSTFNHHPVAIQFIDSTSNKVYTPINFEVIKNSATQFQVNFGESFTGTIRYK